MATKVLMDDDVQKMVERLQERETKRGAPRLPDARALNWLAREGARAMGLAAPVAKKGGET